MHDHIIESMLRALRPALKSHRKAQRILERFWSDKIAIVWDVEDVHRAANETEVALTSQEAVCVLKELHEHHNAQLGLRWEDITSLIEAKVLGRKLTKREVERFVKQEILTIHK